MPTFLIAHGEPAYVAPAEVPGSIGSLPTAVVARIVRYLCYQPWYGGHVEDELYIDDVLPLLLAVPHLYARLRWNADFSAVFEVRGH